MSWIERFEQQFPDSPAESVPKLPEPTSVTSVTSSSQESQNNTQGFVTSGTTESLEPGNKEPLIELKKSLNLLPGDYVWLTKLLALRSDKTVKSAVAGYRAAWAAAIEVQRMPPETNPNDFARRIANAWIRNLIG